MTKADFAAYLILAWELASDRAIQHSWECYDADTKLPGGASAGGSWALKAALSCVGRGAVEFGASKPLRKPGVCERPGDSRVIPGAHGSRPSF